MKKDRRQRKGKDRRQKREKREEGGVVELGGGSGR
jgi:hypothetical protein